MIALRTGQPIEAGKEYVLASWACANEGTEGPPAWDLVEQFIARQGIVRIAPNTSVKVVAA